MSQPEIQRAALVGVAYMGRPEDPDSLVEAVEVTYGFGGAVPPEELIDGAVSVIAPRYYVLEERRRQANWGATGLSVQDVVVLYSINTLSELTTAAIIAGLMKLSKVFQGREIANAELAWTAFDEFLIRCFKVAGAALVEVNETDDGWAIVARSGNRKYEGHVGKDGRVVQARKLS
jgi:hypothetical protein